MRLRGKQRIETRGAFGSDDAGVNKEGDELVPRKIVRGRRGICKIESKASSNEVGAVIG